MMLLLFTFQSYLKNVTFDEAAPFHTRQEKEQVVNKKITVGEVIRS